MSSSVLAWLCSGHRSKDHHRSRDDRLSLIHNNAIVLLTLLGRRRYAVHSSNSKYDGGNRSPKASNPETFISRGLCRSTSVGYRHLCIMEDLK